jgi:hypothetical protein
MKPIITFAFAILFLLIATAFSQDQAPIPLSEQEFSELQNAIKSGDQQTVNAISKRHADRERHRKHGRNHDQPSPKPDRQPDEEESITPDETPDETDADELAPVEGHEERDARKKRHHEERERHQAEIEKQRREQEEYDRVHPKPVQPTGVFGFLWSWVVWPVLGTVLGPCMWFFTLSKWVIILTLLILSGMLITAIVFFGSVALSACSWLWGRIRSIWSKPQQ